MSEYSYEKFLQDRLAGYCDAAGPGLERGDAMDDDFTVRYVLKSMHAALEALFDERNITLDVGRGRAVLEESYDLAVAQRQELFNEYGFYSEDDASEFLESFYDPELRPDDLRYFMLNPEEDEFAMFHAVYTIAGRTAEKDPELRDKFIGAANMLWSEGLDEFFARKM